MRQREKRVPSGTLKGGLQMDMVSSIADMSMTMSAAKFQQDLGLTMMKKTMETSVDMMNGVLDMIDSIPPFPGANGSILDVRA